MGIKWLMYFTKVIAWAAQEEAGRQVLYICNFFFSL